MFEQVLFLVPTRHELDILREFLPPNLQMELCGFGPVAAGIESMRQFCRPEFKSVRQAILVGIGGTYDDELLPVGSAASFRQVSLFGVGAGTEADWHGPSKMQLPQLVTDDGTACFETISIEPFGGSRVAQGLLTVTSSSIDLQQANLRRQQFPTSVCEDMEGFSVALAAGQKALPVSIIRGISNVAGDRHKANWKIREALRAAAAMLTSAG